MTVLKIIPSIDLFGGRVVRFVRGNPETSHVYSEDPVKTAEKWSRQGAHAIHVVDLDSALGTGVDNRVYILNIADAVDIPVQVGGGIRSFSYASSLLEEGVARLVIGTLAFRDPPTLKKMIKAFGSEKVVVALDYVGEEVVVKGWTASTGISIQVAITSFQNLGADIFLLTSVERDGTLTGPDYQTLRNILKTFRIRILASGGIRSIHDLVHLNEIGVYAVVIGKALYEEKFSLKYALSATRRR
ncbi:MAG: 1-(5-phosphoribosyl)-5-[(5-phosphoribosylamino)methylideneamino]imidazole-4-carboxamide isomerase [Nitrososphaerales archaeon]